MNKRYKVILLACLLNAITACDSDSSNDNSTSYDMADYFFPTLNDGELSIVDKSEFNYFLNDDGTWSSYDLGDETDIYSAIAGVTQKEEYNGDIVTFKITDSKVTSSYLDDSELVERDIVRHVQIGSVLTSNSLTTDPDEEGKIKSYKSECIINDYHDSLFLKDVHPELPEGSFTNVIELECVGTVTSTNKDNSVEHLGTDYSYVYFSKNVGVILDFDPYCFDNDAIPDDSLIEGGNYEQCRHAHIQVDVFEQNTIVDDPAASGGFDLVDYLFPTLEKNRNTTFTSNYSAYSLDSNDMWIASEQYSKYKSYMKFYDGSVRVSRTNDISSTSFSSTWSFNYSEIKKQNSDLTKQRYVNVGDRVYETESGGESYDMFFECTINDFYENFQMQDVDSILPDRSYSDVLEQKCVRTDRSWNGLDKTDIFYKSVDIRYTYFAQGIGEILSVNKDCAIGFELVDNLLESDEIQQCENVTMTTDIIQENI